MSRPGQHGAWCVQTKVFTGVAYSRCTQSHLGCSLGSLSWLWLPVADWHSLLAVKLRFHWEEEEISSGDVCSAGSPVHRMYSEICCVHRQVRPLTFTLVFRAFVLLQIWRLLSYRYFLVYKLAEYIWVQLGVNVLFFSLIRILSKLI